jgi:DNA end-binding protein Ku
MAQRSVWSGSISFGLVAIPVKLYGAVTKKSVSFKGLEAATLKPMRQQMVSSVSAVEVPADKRVKGFEVGRDTYVVVSEEELTALMPAQQHTIEIEEFVDADSIDPIFFDTTYTIAPDKIAKPYALLASALADTGKVGIARFVMRTKQYVCAVRSRDGHLELATMVYADEVNDHSNLEELDLAENATLSDAEKAMAITLVESLAADKFDPAKYADEYRMRVAELVEAKVLGNEIVLPAAPPAVAELDLMAALEASVKAAQTASEAMAS